MSFLEELITEINKAKQPKKESKINKFLEFEKQLRDLAKSKGLQPRTFLEQLAKSNPELAKNKIIIKLIGEQDVPQQKGRDAKPEVLTKRAMNTVKKGIKQAANKQRRRMDKDAVEEDAEQDAQYAKMIIQQNPQEYKKFMQTGDLMDAPTVYEKLFAYFSSSDASDQMPYGTMKARDGDPYVWLVDKLDDLGLTEAKMSTIDLDIKTLSDAEFEKKYGKSKQQMQKDLEEGNEFAQKVRQMKAAGAKKGTKFKTSDGEEHTLEQISKKTIDSFHTELDQLVHKYFGHSSDEKREKVKEDDDKGEVMVGSYQTKHFDICPSATRLYKDIDVEDMDLAERSAKLHDTLFYMEKHAQEMKEAEPEYIEMMQNLADQIMAMAGMMGLESEHSYVQGHVDAVKNLGESVESVEAITEQEFDEAAGEKDACYHKVKSRYKVWPSAYASGALVKCRKVGASNWGKKGD